MSSVLVESPVAGGQLVFPWTGESETELPNAAPPESQPVQPPARPIGKRAAPDPSGHQPRELADGEFSEPIRSSGLPRAGQPVRIGTVMIKLLKRYGITDDEIAAGLDSYARRQATQAAS